MSKDKSDLILHPVRWRILRAAAAGAVTAQSLASALPDVSQASLYRHLNALLSAGLLRVAEERRVRGTVERVFALGERADDLSAEELAHLSEEGHLRLFGAFLSTLLADYARYLQRGDIDLYRDGVGFRQRELYLSDDEFAGMARELRSLVERFSHNEPANGRVPRLFTMVLMPAACPRNDAATNDNRPRKISEQNA